MVWSFTCWVKLSWRTPTAVWTSQDLFSTGSRMPLSHYPISQGTDYLWSSSTLMAKEAGRFEDAIQPHGKASGRIHIWLLDSRHCPSMSFHGPYISLSAVVILLVYDQCLQTLGRLKLYLSTINICRCSYFSAFTQDQNRKNIGQTTKFHQILPYPKANVHTA